MPSERARWASAGREPTKCGSMSRGCPATAIAVSRSLVGIDGAAAVSSYPHLGWELFREAWAEKYLGYGTTMYDLKISKSISKERYEWLAEQNKHFITLPGIIAFFFYPGSFAFLFMAMLLVGAIGAGIEIATYKLSGAVILSALIAFVVAYRFAHFGYVPARSYLLFGAIALNIALIYLANRFLAARYADRKALA
jgi:hypothetical protein